MAALEYTIVFRSGARGAGLKVLALEIVSATAADTVTVAEFIKVSNSLAFRLDTGGTVTCTEATNVVTIGAGPATTPMLIVVAGW